MPSTAGCFSNLPTSQFSLKAVSQLGYSDCKIHSATVTVTTCTSSLNSTSALVSSSQGSGAENSGTCLLTPVDVKSHSSYGAAMAIDHSRMGSHAPRTDDHLVGVSIAAMSSTSLLTQHRSEQNHCHDNTNVLTMTGPSANILRLNFPINKALSSSNSIHTPFVPPRVNSSEFPNLERTKISNSNSQPYLDNHHSLCNSVMDLADKPVESATRNLFDDPRQLKQVLATAAG